MRCDTVRCVIRSIYNPNFVEQWQINSHTYGIYKPMASLPTVVCTAILFNHLLVKSTIVIRVFRMMLIIQLFQRSELALRWQIVGECCTIFDGTGKYLSNRYRIVWQCSLVTYITMNDSFTQLFTYMFN